MSYNTCPSPSSINPLSSNGSNFSIQKLQEISFFCQEVTLPGISLPSIDVNTPLSINPILGEMIQFDDLNIQFLVDENMSNYRALYNWMIGAGFPSDNLQYSQFIASQTTGYSTLSKEFSDATLQILGSNNLPSRTVRFIDIIPISVSSMSFQSTNTDVVYITCSASFKINRFEFVD